MLREIVAVPPLHAGRALVGRVLLDPGAGHAEDRVVADVEVHLAAHAAIRAHAADHALGRGDLGGEEPFAGEDLVDGTGRAHPDALAAPGAAGVVGVAVAADDDLGVLPPLRDVEDPDHLDVCARPDAAGAEDAGAHVVADHRVAGPLVPRPEPQDPRRGRPRRHAVAADHRLELVEVVPLGGDPLRRIALEQHRQHAAPVRHRFGGLRLHRHPRLRQRRARRRELRRPRHRDEADPARARRRELRIPAQRRHVDPGGARGVENRRALADRDGSAVDRECDHGLHDVGGDTVNLTGPAPPAQSRAAKSIARRKRTHILASERWQLLDTSGRQYRYHSSSDARHHARSDPKVALRWPCRLLPVFPDHPDHASRTRAGPLSVWPPATGGRRSVQPSLGGRMAAKKKAVKKTAKKKVAKKKK